MPTAYDGVESTLCEPDDENPCPPKEPIFEEIGEPLENDGGPYEPDGVEKEEDGVP